jgi:hypothetical protein
MKKFLIFYNVALLALALGITALSMRAVYADTLNLSNPQASFVVQKD